MFLGKHLSAATVLLALLPVSGLASSISYSNVEGGYQKMSGDGSFDGLFIRGSFQLLDQVYIAASYDELEDKGISQETMSLRGGMFFPINPGFDLYGEAGLMRAKISSKIPGWGKVSDSETGLHMEGGARLMAGPRFEARTYIRHVNSGDFDETFLGAQGVATVSGPFAVHAGVSRLFDASEFLFEVGGRFQF